LKTIKHGTCRTARYERHLQCYRAYDNFDLIAISSIYSESGMKLFILLNLKKFTLKIKAQGMRTSLQNKRNGDYKRIKAINGNILICI
jgi:hypothetical protein